MWISKKKLENIIEEAKSEAEWEFWKEARAEKAERLQDDRISDIEGRLNDLERNEADTVSILEVMEARMAALENETAVKDAMDILSLRMDSGKGNNGGCQCGRKH